VDAGTLEQSFVLQLANDRAAAWLNGFTRPMAVILPRLRTIAVSGMRCSRASQTSKLVEPLRRDGLARQVEIVDQSNDLTLLEAFLAFSNASMISGSLPVGHRWPHGLHR
jgi:hypothetical protein